MAAPRKRVIAFGPPSLMTRIINLLRRLRCRCLRRHIFSLLFSTQVIWMMLRGRDAANADNVAAGQEKNVRNRIKRQITQSLANHDSDKGEPKAKRASFSDVMHVMSNIRVDTSKSAALQPKKVINGVSISEREPQKALPASPDPCLGFDLDKENAADLLSFSEYAFDIFQYHKARENMFRVSDYTSRQRNVTKEARAAFLAWMVKIQRNFELNYETLYLAVKLLDTYIGNIKEIVRCQEFQLIGSSAIFIAAKYEERRPPLIADFLYFCDHQFTRDQLCAMERKMLEIVGFDLGMPLSYRFLRRYANVSKVDMVTLALALFILETSLMFIEFVVVPESLMAAAAFLLALRMKKMEDWTPVLKKYSGYKVEDVEPLMWALNHMMHSRATLYPKLHIIFRKYSDEMFLEVAKIPLLPNRKSITEPVGPPEVLQE
ncbi:hypothetical protein QR680_000549 [Steinernema hermaphroditum]|uniref:G2/mitotic-specific cyclin-B3 n=1 Tax=Steinernema hermaphroditum TaxID=289476 RepID=A0AA39GWY7_9BILA|nr:hypothetical protein QR680_000549 [Steinernema hermaphroditum]